MSACLDRATALHVMLDGELDSLASADLERHIGQCEGCRAEFDRLEDLRLLFAQQQLGYRAPQRLRDTVVAMLPPERPSPSVVRRTAWPWLGGGVIGALAASLALLVTVPQVSEGRLDDELIAAHVRSLQAFHLTDIATSNQHVVKPWFNGRIDFAPPVVELAPQGFPLIGGRLDYIGKRDVAALVYQRRLHRINLFIRPAPALVTPLTYSARRQSYNLVRWESGGLEFWAVSDVDLADLESFRRAFRAASGS